MSLLTHSWSARTKQILRVATALLSLGAAAQNAHAQWSTTYETFYLQAPHNWVFRNNYQSADRLFNAFDYGHAILYETLLTKPNAPASELEEKVYNKLTQQVLVRPPRVPLEEAAIEIKYAQLAPEAKVMFDWSHILHRQIYDVLADERLNDEAKDREVQRLIAYYKTRRDVAFSSKPKSMKLMQEQPYSLAFRERYPKFNGLIWGYHWLQVGLYEPLMVGTTREARQAGVRATAARFWQMLGDPLRSLPYQMPMTAAVSPTFAARYPEAAIIFDNLHSMHDVVSDILANPNVPRNRKRAEIMLAASRFRDDSSYVMSEPAWRTMSTEMGLQNMGGAPVNFASELPAPTVTRGAVMQHDDATGKMIGMKTGSMTGGMAEMDHAAMGHAMPAATDTAQTSDSVAVLGVVETFHKALVAGDSTAALALLAPNLVVMEGGGVETFAEFRKSHLPADIAFARAVSRVRGPATVVIKGDAAWVSSTSTTEGTFRERPVNSVGAELMVLSRVENGWRISAIHWSSRARR